MSGTESDPTVNKQYIKNMEFITCTSFWFIFTTIRRALKSLLLTRPYCPHGLPIETGIILYLYYFIPYKPLEGFWASPFTLFWRAVTVYFVIEHPATCVFMYTHITTRIHTHTHAHTHTHTHRPCYVCVYVHTHNYTYTHTHTPTHTHTDPATCVFLYTHNSNC